MRIRTLSTAAGPDGVLAEGSVWECACAYPGTTPVQIGNGHGNVAIWL